MPYTTIHWIKLEKRLLNDPRFFTMSERAQLVYIKLILLCAHFNNKVPRSMSILSQLCRCAYDESTLKSVIDEIRNNFPKLLSRKDYYYIKGFKEMHNWVSPGSSQGVPKDVPDKKEDKSKNKKEDKIDISVAYPFLADNSFKDLWEAWLEVRRKMKAPNTERALDIALKKLHTYSLTMACQMVEQSVERGWRGVFELKKGKKEVTGDSDVPESMRKFIK